MTTDLVFLDTETTGLDPRIHDVWELAWARLDEPVETVILPHSLKTADPAALELNGYFRRFPNGARANGPVPDVMLRKLFDGVTIVGANPAFDTAFLFARWGVAPWHYRLIDVEAMAFGVLGYDRPRGLKTIADDLRARDFYVSEPDHTAAGDVETLRDSYTALREITGAAL